MFDAVRSGGPAALWSCEPNLLPGLLVLALATVGVAGAARSLAKSAWH